MQELLSFCLVMDLYGNYCIKQGIQRETRIVLLEEGDGRTRESHVRGLGTHALDRHCSRCLLLSCISATRSFRHSCLRLLSITVAKD